MSDLLAQEKARSAKAVTSTPPNGREDIVLMAEKGCAGVELGVDTGQFSRRILELNHLDVLHSVDKWDDHAHNRFQYLAVVELLQPYSRSKVYRMTAQEFATLLPDASLGFIYIDCYAHTGQDDGQILHQIWPKLKKGGIFSGDDYDEHKWPKTFAAVNNFAAEKGYVINVITEFIASAGSYTDSHPTWWLKKS